jgi:site-specific recombinase XerD
MTSAKASPTFPALVQDFFLQALGCQKGASPRTIEAYRDTFRLLLAYAQKRLKKSPVDFALRDLDASLLLGFLDHLENDRGNSVRTRNARLTAVRSFLHYASLRDVTELPALQRSLAIPMKRFDKPLLGFLSRQEMESILAAPDRSTWSGERDFVLFSTAYNTGTRVSELAALKVEDVELAHRWIRILGKGRKLRQVPIWKSTAILLKNWIKRCNGGPSDPVFPNRQQKHMTRSGVEKRLRAAVRAAVAVCPSLVGRKISPHTLRHTTAMHLLQAGVDLSSIALWLGHTNPSTTHAYVEADLAMKERTLHNLAPPSARSQRFHADDRLVAFLNGL